MCVTHRTKVNSEKNVLYVHQYIKVIYLSENILVTLDWVQSMNESGSSDMKINDCSTSINHKFSLSQSHKCGHLIMFCWKQDPM